MYDWILVCVKLVNQRLNDMWLPNVIVKWIILVKYLSKSIVLLKLKSKEDQSRIGEKRK